MPKLAFSLLGTPRLERDGLPVEVDTRKAIALLAYLAVTDQTQARDTLATLLWPENNQSRARASLRRTLSALNKALDRYGLDIQREVVGIASDADIWLDVNQFRQLLGVVDKHSHSSDRVCPTCLTLLEEAVELYQGDFMTGFTLRDSPGFDDWQFFQGESLRRELSQALKMLVISHSARGGHQRGIEYARRWLSLDPLLESAHRHLMRLYAWSDQRNAALRQYRECVRILEEELGVTPLEKTTLLYQTILENAHPPQPTLERPVETEVLHPLQEKPSFKLEHVYPLVGREKQWQVMIGAYRKTREDGHFLILKGETGIGKTRLAQEFLSHVQTQGGVTITGICHEGEIHLAYGPFLDGLRAALETNNRAQLEKIGTHWLSEAARLMPEIATHYPEIPIVPPLEGPGAQNRFFESLRQVLLALLSGRSAGVLFLDDLHWADAASLDLLAYLARRLRGSGAFFLGTWNTDMAPKNHHLERLIAKLQREGKASHLTLPRLQDTDISELVFSLDATGLGQKEEISQQLYRESEGLPFLAIEYLKTILEGNESVPTANWDIPASAREVLRSRIALIDETARQLLGTAAIIGRSFDFHTLQEASGRSEEETLNGLESLLLHGLIVEHQASEERIALSYDFTHDKLRQVTLEEISLTRRRLLHRRVAEALVSPARRQPEPDSFAGLVAYHYQQGGDETQAAIHYKLAGERARKLHANMDALVHFQAALALGHPEIAELHEAIGDLYILQGEYMAAIASYQKAAALCKPACLTILEHKLGNVQHRLGDWDMAECHYMAALDVSEEENDPVELSRLYADLSRTAHHQNQPARAKEMAHLALKLAEETKNQSALAQAQNILGVLARRQGNPSQATQHLRVSLEISKKLPNPEARVAALNNLALAYADNDQLDEAITLIKEALGICVQMGDRHRQAALHNNLADLFHAAGQEAESMEELKKAVVIFAEIGVDAGSKQAEIWKLTEW